MDTKNAKILIKKNGQYCKMIPNGLLWIKELGDLNSNKKISKEFGIRQFVPEYWRLIEAGYVDQTNVFSPQEYDLSNVNSECAGLIKNLLECTKKHMMDNYNKDYLSSGQILSAEMIFEELDKIVLESDFIKNAFNRKIEELYACLFKKNCKTILSSCNNIEDMKKLLEQEKEEFYIAKATNASFNQIPLIQKCSEEKKKEVELALNFSCKDLYEVNPRNQSEGKLMFHASPDYNWISIISHGLLCEQKVIHGNSYGPGIYLSNTYGYAQRYADVYKKSDSQIVGIFTVKEDNNNVSQYGWGMVVRDGSIVNLKYISLA